MSPQSDASEPSHGGIPDALLVMALAAVPVGIVLWLTPGARSLVDMVLVTQLITFPIMLVSAALLYISWRFIGYEGMPWLVTALTLVSVQGLGLAGLRLARDGQYADRPAWLVMTDVLAAAVALLLIVRGRRHTLRVDPLGLGLLLALVVLAARLPTVVYSPDLQVPDILVVALGLAAVAGYLVTAQQTWCYPRTTPWVTKRVAVAVACLTLAHASSTPVPYDDGRAVVAIVLNGLGATLLAVTGWAVVSRDFRRHRQTVQGLQHKIEDIEAGLRVDRARLHEIGATVAGIASASRLLHSNAHLPASRRTALEEMLDSEMARLQRLMHDQAPREPRAVQLDQLLAPLVLAHQSRGHRVHWRPTGWHALGHADDIAETVNILLENAAQHGGTEVEIAIRRNPWTVEVLVCDRGPGIPDDVRDRIFEWGQRGSSSTGQGIGLHIAQQLAEGQGGYLRLEHTEGPGSTFVLGLPRTDRPESGGTDDRDDTAAQ